MRSMLILSAILSLSACATPAPKESGSTPPPQENTQAMAENADQMATRILDSKAAETLRGAEGVTLQWISWDWRGRVEVRQVGDIMLLVGGQNAADAPTGTRDLGSGSVMIDGVITEIGSDYFLFDGDIIIADSPDIGRLCKRSGPMTFKVTQNRKYWRLQEMEHCDGLTDYVDIYF